MTRREYEKRFANYPDVVKVPDLCEMLGGIGHNTGQKLLKENHIKHFYVRTTYMIPKKCIIDYLMSKDYKEYKKKLKHHIE